MACVIVQCIYVCHCQVILCTKEVNEKTRLLALKLLIKLGYVAQKCSDKKSDGKWIDKYTYSTCMCDEPVICFQCTEAVSDYLLTVLAGLAGSTHMVSATLLSLSRLVYEFHGML